jgi:DNA helicase-2/ATP-dependent DNA helicase PcrA
VRIMSMHAAKGLTADAVIIPACDDELIPGLDHARQVVDDERRLLYVSLTRARHALVVTYAASRPGAQTFRITGVPVERTYTQFLRDFLPPTVV